MNAGSLCEGNLKSRVRLDGEDSCLTDLEDILWICLLSCQSLAIPMASFTLI